MLKVGKQACTGDFVVIGSICFPATNSRIVVLPSMCIRVFLINSVDKGYRARELVALLEDVIDEACVCDRDYVLPMCVCMFCALLVSVRKRRESPTMCNRPATAPASNICGGCGMDPCACGWVFEMSGVCEWVVSERP